MAHQVAIDIGNDTIRVADLARKGSRWLLRRWSAQPLDEVALLPDDDAGKRGLLARRLKEAVRNARTGLDGAVAALPGRACTVRYLRVPPVPAWRLEMLVRFEATEQLAKGAPCCHDHQILALPYMPGQMVVLVGVAQEQAAEDCMALLKTTGADDPELDLATTAVFNAYACLHGTLEGRATLLLDIGAEGTHVLIERNGRLYFARTLTTGGRRITQALMQELHADYREAEELKRRLGVRPEQEGLDERERRAAVIILKEVSALAASIEASILYAQTQTLQKDLRIERVVLAGGGAELAGLPAYLARRLKAEAEPFEPARNLEVATKVPPSAAELRGMALALGLALARLDPDAFALDMLPERYKSRRSFFSRDIYLYYAAAVFLVALGLYVYQGVREYLGARRRLAAATATLQQDEDILGRYKARRHGIEELDADISALLDRVYSGEEILRVLSIFKKKTPPEVHLIDMNVDPPRPILDELAFPSGGTFQETRRLYVRGIATSRQSDEDTMAKVRAFVNEISAPEVGLFSMAEIVHMAWEENKRGDTFFKEFVIMLEVARRKST